MVALAVPCSVVQGGVKLIPDAPAYPWYNGCGPTAAGMVIGYWQAHGFPNLISGGNSWSANQQAVKDMIGSPGYIRDYLPTPDRSPTAGDPLHRDNCVADFMHCSRNPLQADESLENAQYTGLADYSRYCGYYGVSARYEYYLMVWSDLVSAINSANPVELFVDSNGDGTADHFVTAIGYDDTNGSKRYACYNTWDLDVHWYTFQPIGKVFGVQSATFFTLYLPGDSNQDGKVSFADYIAMANNFGQKGASWGMGDFNGDGTVSFSDYIALANNFGQATPAPEPGSAILLLTGAWVVLAGRKSRRARRVRSGAN